MRRLSASSASDSSRRHDRDFRSPRAWLSFSARLALGNLGDGVEHAGDLDRRAVGLDRLCRRQVKHLGQAPQARIGPQRAKEGLRLGETVAKGVELVDTEEQQTVAAEERMSGRIENVAEDLRPLAQPLGEFQGGIVDSIGVVAVNDDDDGVDELGKNGVDGPVVAPELQVRRQHVGGVGVDGYRFGEIGRRRNGQRRRNGDDGDRGSAHKVGPFQEKAPASGNGGVDHGPPKAESPSCRAGRRSIEHLPAIHQTREPAVCPPLTPSCNCNNA